MSPLSCVIFVGLLCSIYASPIVLSPEDDDVIALPDFGPRSYAAPSNKTGDLVANWDPSMNINPEEMGEYVEGDMMIPPSMTKSGMVYQTFRWPNGVVPYAFAGSFNTSQKLRIYAAMHDIASQTCVRFVGRTTQQDYIRFTDAPTGCYSMIGRIGGAQDINLQVPGCLTLWGTMLHEIMHALGFIHEHSRPERDNFVKIYLNNVQTGQESNFNKYPATQVSSFNVSYDYGSVMHYSAIAFSKNGFPTILPMGQLKLGGLIGQRTALSASDVNSIKAMYNCK